MIKLKKYIFLTFVLAIFIGGQLTAQNKVLIIGIDGCRPDALLNAKTENLDKLWKNGAYSFTTKTDELSSSGICWTGMMTGVWHEKHNVLTNSYKNPNTDEYPHFFKRIKQEKPQLKTYSIVNWGPLHTIFDKEDVTESKVCLTDRMVRSNVIKTLKHKDVDVLFLQFDNVDHAGHSSGYGPDNKKYLEAIERKDKDVGKIIKALESRKNYANENWLILVSTDHGGSEKGHGKNIPEHTTIFYIANGKSVKKGELKKQVSNIDVAVTALKHLGIDAKPEWNLDGNVSGLKN